MVHARRRALELEGRRRDGQRDARIHDERAGVARAVEDARARGHPGDGALARPDRRAVGLDLGELRALVGDDAPARSAGECGDRPSLAEDGERSGGHLSAT